MIMPISVTDCIAVAKEHACLYDRCKNYGSTMSAVVSVIGYLSTVQRFVEDLGADWSPKWIATNQVMIRRMEEKIDADPLGIRKTFSSNLVASAMWSRSNMTRILDDASRHVEMAINTYRMDVERNKERLYTSVLSIRKSC